MAQATYSFFSITDCYKEVVHLIQPQARNKIIKVMTPEK